MAASAVVVLGGGFGIWKAVSSPDAPATPPPVVTQAQEPPAAAPTTTAPPAQQPEPQPPANVAATGTKTEPRPTPAVPEPAHITVLDVPANAVIMLDGRRQSSRQFNASPGTHQLRVQASGFETMNRPIAVRAGQDFSIAFDRRELAAARAPTPAPVQPIATKQAPALQQGGSGLAKMGIIVQPPATLYIDGESKGERSRMLEEVVPGTHQVRAEKAGFITKDTVVTVLAGATATIRLQLTPRP